MIQPSISVDAEPEQIIQHYSAMVYRLAYARTGSRQDADEIYQEVFLRYIRKNPRFQSPEHQKAWFLRVTVNCANTFWRSPWRQMEPLKEDTAFETREEVDLSYALQKLPPKYREVIHLFYYEDLSVEQISRILKRKPSTVRTQLTRARTILKTWLKEEDYEF